MDYQILLSDVGNLNGEGLSELLRDVEGRKQILDGLSILIREGFPEVAGISGMANEDIPWAAGVCQRLGLPMVYVRKTAKIHGLKKRIEGELAANTKTLIIVGYLSNTATIRSQVEALRDEANLDVVGFVAAVAKADVLHELSGDGLDSFALCRI